MKCSRCLSVCLESDSYCPSCRHPLFGDGPTPARARRRIAARMALAFGAIGACLGPVVVRAFFPQLLTELLDAKVIPYAACGAGIGWVLGYALGAFAFEMDARGNTVAEAATFRPRRTVEL